MPNPNTSACFTQVYIKEGGGGNQTISYSCLRVEYNSRSKPITMAQSGL